MRAVAYQRSLPIEDPLSLQDVDLPEPEPAARDLLVQVSAVAANPVDTKQRKRAQPPDGQWAILGYDAVGVVREIGPDVRLFAPGDRVWYAGSIKRPGTNAELHVVDERLVALAPTTVDDASAAALPLTSITAYELLFHRVAVPRRSTGAVAPAGRRTRCLSWAPAAGSARSWCSWPASSPTSRSWPPRPGR